MNDEVLCICYSRTGRTRRAMKAVAAGLDCELVELRDDVRRRGALGWLRCGLDAMRRHTSPIRRLNTARPLGDYRLVVLGTPVWAGRCSAVMRALLKRRGYELHSVAYLLTHRSETPYREVFDQMDRYLLPETERAAEVSLTPGATGYEFWLGDFIRSCADYLEK